MSSIKDRIKGNPLLFKAAHVLHAPVVKIKTTLRRRPAYKKELAFDLNKLDGLQTDGKTIWYCGVPTHYNLGDQAQAVCIRHWLKANYGEDYRIVELLAFPFYSRRFRNKLGRLVGADDFFVIQSGYCTSDSHYNHYMHRYIAAHFDNPVLIMPQTVNFHKEKEGYKTGRIYRKHKNLLFLARDRQSFEYAKKYFMDTKILLYPDIVTGMIGTREWDGRRNGILLCIRDDGEKLYSDEQIEALRKMIEQKGLPVEITDTNYSEKEGKLGIEAIIDSKLKRFSFYQAVITDRYHGTIFSMIANTPVIVLATNDHKVRTGSEWFKGVYDGAFYNADSTREAFDIAMRIVEENKPVDNSPYFKEKYYDILGKTFSEYLSDK